MTKLIVLAGAGLIALAGSALAQAGPNPIQGTPGSLFPLAAPNEVETINGMPCRTVFDEGANRRVPVECVAPDGRRFTVVDPNAYPDAAPQ